MRRGYELRLMAQRADTLHRRASDLFNMMDGSDEALKALAADTMCSAAELAGALRGRQAGNAVRGPAPVDATPRKAEGFEARRAGSAVPAEQEGAQTHQQPNPLHSEE